jgi:hypothetical protein
MTEIDQLKQRIEVLEKTRGPQTTPAVGWKGPGLSAVEAIQLAAAKQKQLLESIYTKVDHKQPGGFVMGPPKPREIQGSHNVLGSRWDGCSNPNLR